MILHTRRKLPTDTQRMKKSSEPQCSTSPRFDARAHKGVYVHFMDGETEKHFRAALPELE